MKENVVVISDALKKLELIRGVAFDWIEKPLIHSNTGHDVGVIAQEIEKILPEIVETRANGYKAVKYDKIVALLIEAIKDLKKEIDILKNK